MGCSCHNQKINDRCFVCGYDNPAGLGAQFVESAEEPGCVVGLFTPRDIHMSYPGRLHGGVAAAMCDETIGRAFITDHPDQWGVTMELSLRYRKPTPLNEQLKVLGRITKVTRRTFEGTCELVRTDGTVCVTARATYMILPVDRIIGECTDEEGYVWEDDGRPVPEAVETA